MDTKMQEGFNAILQKNQLPSDANWKPLLDWIDLQEYQIQGEEDEREGLMFIDAEELIRLIKILQSSWEVNVKGSAGTIPLKDTNLKKYLVLSLHKLLQLSMGLDKPCEEDRAEGIIKLLAPGSADWVKVGLKKELEGEEGGFIQPYDGEELEALLGLAQGMKRYNRIQEGRGKNVVALGNKVAVVLASIPSSVKVNLSKTDLLNFAGEVMALAGVLDEVPKWKELSEELVRCEMKGWNVGDLRKERKKMLANWLKGAKDAYYKSEITDKCKECKMFDSCAVTRRLADFDI